MPELPHFAAPWVLALLPLVLPLAAWAGMRRGARAAVMFSSIERPQRVRRTWRVRLRHLPLVLRLVGLAALIVALARPQQSIGHVQTRTKGVAIMAVIDRSYSMIDAMSYRGKPSSRIGVVKEVFKEFIQGNGDDLGGRREDLIGLVTFARYADTVAPLVREHAALVDLVERIELADRQGMEAGTAVGEGIALAAARLKKAEEEIAKQNEREPDPEFQLKSKVIILLTDGDENMGEIRMPQAGQLCKEWGIKVYAIGIGGERGRTGRGPAWTLGGPAGGRYPFREEPLKRLAQLTGGRYWAATDGEALREVYEEIDALEKTEVETTRMTDVSEEFAPWALAAAAAFALETLLAATLLRRSP